jgi:hypothetical protein
MLLPEHKFLVQQVGTTDRTKDGKHEFQTIVLLKPGYTNEFGEKVGEDDIYECKAWNKTLSEMPVLKHGDKVSALLNMQGRKWIDKENGNINYQVQLTIRKLTLL